MRADSRLLAGSEIADRDMARVVPTAPKMVDLGLVEATPYYVADLRTRDRLSKNHEIVIAR